MKTITDLAREAGVRDCTCNGTLGCLERFAELVRADAIATEREACAKVCDVLAVHPEYASEVTKLAAMAIRNRSNK